MDLSEGLPVELKIVNQDYSWTQALDYENISFRCRSCYNIGHLAKACPKMSQSYKHCKATWWMGACPEHYTVTNDESTKLNDTDNLQLENTTETIHAFKDPQIEQTQESSTETLRKSSGESTPGPCTTTSPKFSEWKLVTKKILGVTTIPRESGGNKGTQQLSFGTLKLPALNKATHFLLEKSGFIEKSGNTWMTNDGNKKEEQ